MRTAVVRIGEPKANAPGSALNGDFPVELWLSENGDTQGLAAVPGALTSIPALLTPEQVVSEPGGQPLTAVRASEIYAETEEPSEALAQVGEFLYRLLARGELGKAWRRLRDETTDGLLTILEIANGAACGPLRALPWERMYDPDSGSHWFLEAPHVLVRGEARTVEEENQLVRVAARAHRFPLDDWPLRVLLVFGADPDFKSGSSVPGGIGATRELEALETLFAASRLDVECQLLEHPSRDEIVRKCDKVQPHVLHFIGHGQADGTPADHCLKIWRPAQANGTLAGYEDWTLHDIRTDLQSVKPPAFVFLNACRTAGAITANGAKTGISAPFGSLAETFLNLGALGVLGMQGDVPGDVAAEFARAFYEAVIAGDSVDFAATNARRKAAQLPERKNLVKRSAWSFPVLRTRVLPALVLPARPGVPGQTLFVERFVTQVPERRLIREAVRNKGLVADQKSGPSPHLVAIVGEEGAGKTHLAKWCAQICARSGLRAAHVTFGEEGSLDLVNALRCLRDGTLPVPGKAAARSEGAPLTANAARRFTWELNHRLRGVSLVPPLPDGTAVADEGLQLSNGSQPDESFIPAVFGQFRLALEESARPSGLLLVLDHVSTIQEAHLDLLIAHLLNHVAAGSVNGVRVIVIAHTQTFQKRLKALRDGPGGATVVEVGSFERSELEWVARHLRLQWTSKSTNAALVAALPQLVATNLPFLLTSSDQQQRWKAGGLKQLDAFLSLLCQERRS